MITKDEALNTIAVKHGHKDWELARYRLGDRHLHVLILEAMEYYASQSNSHKQVVMQAEGSDVSEGAAVASSAVGEANTCADCGREIPIGEPCYSCEYGAMFGH